MVYFPNGVAMTAEEALKYGLIDGIMEKRK